MVTVELAVAIPAALLVLALCLAGLTLGIDQLRCTDAARVAARAASRGEPEHTVVGLAEGRAPAGATVVVVQAGAGVRVEVVGPDRDGPLPGLPRARAEAAAPWEPGARP